jgi:hypothetical protein
VDQGGVGGGNGRQMDSGYLLKVEQMAFTIGFSKRRKKNRNKG